MTTRPPAASAPASVPYVEGLPELYEASGYRVTLSVSRADGRPLTPADREAIEVAARSRQTPSDRTDEELAEAIDSYEARVKATTRPKKKATGATSKGRKASKTSTRKAARREVLLP